MKFLGVTILQGVEFPIFLFIFAWALQQCSATALPVILHMELNVKIANADSNLTNNTFSVVDVETALGKLKTGKSPGVDGIVKEHLLYSHPSIIVYVTLLFNMMSLHCFVPDDFGMELIVSIVKERLGNIADVNNYRGIKLSPVISKLLEYCILDKYYMHHSLHGSAELL